MSPHRAQADAAAGGDAVHGANHGLREAGEFAHQRVVADLHRVRDAFTDAALNAVAKVVAGEVGAGAKAAAGARDDQGAHGGIAAERAQSGADVVDQGLVQAVERLRPVERQARNAVCRLEQDVLEAHEVPSNAVSASGEHKL